MFLFSNLGYAQSFFERVHFEASTGAGIENKGITPLDFSFKAHVDMLSRMYVFFSLENNLAHLNDNETKTYYKSNSLGGGVGVQLLGKNSTTHALDARMKVLTCVGNTDWKRTSFDACLTWYIKNNKTMFSPVVELGYRFLNSRTKGINNYGNAYLSFGIRY